MSPRRKPILAEPVPPTDGTWPISALGPHQCRYACTAHDVARDEHRFCGRPTAIASGNLHGSWCDEHRALVFGPGTVSERAAGEVGREIAA